MSSSPSVGGVITYAIRNNTWGDSLPIIPQDSSVQNGSVLFRVDLDVVLTLNGVPAAGVMIPFEVTGEYSNAKLLSPTDASGCSILRMETRYSGLNTITPMAPGYSHSTCDVTISEAWYEATFLITAYKCADEADFSGPMVMGRGVGLHKQDFLYGGNGIIMEGTGRGLDGKYIQISNPQAMRWNPHYAGVSNPDDAIFEYTDAPQGAFCNVVENVSIAVDPTVLPAHHRVYIAGSRDIGERRADDTGGAIRKFHFDHYVGAGKSAINAWEHAGGNITNAKVKYLGL